MSASCFASRSLRRPLLLITLVPALVVGGLLTATAFLPASASPPFTLRVDYFHSGTATEEHFSLDGISLEGPWPGPPDKAVDPTNFGKYYFEVVDRKTNRVLYSRGFASIYGEWETTPEAQEQRRTFSESLRFPVPAGPVQVNLKKRDARNAFREVWTFLLDPADKTIDRTPPDPRYRVWPVMRNGDPSEKVDLLLLGDGYSEAEMDKWRADAKRLAGTLFAVSPFRERRTDFNVWAIDSPSPSSGVARVSDGVYRRSALRANYDAFGSERYILTFDNKRLRDVAAAAPYEFIEIIVNERKYGGGGIFNLYATVSADNAFTPYVFVHEFGHHFAGLADEYYTSDVAYASPTQRPEPWEPNVTANAKAPKWMDLVAAGTPLPTPWAKDEFEAEQNKTQARRRELRAAGRPESEMEDLFRRERDFTTRLLAAPPYGAAVGAFEGAMYEAKGYYRPQADCIMFTRDEVGFCQVCRRAISQIISLYTGGGNAPR